MASTRRDRQRRRNGDGATDNNGDGATDDNDDDGDNGAAADDDNNDDANDVNNIDDNNLPTRVGKRNDGCDETKMKEEETVTVSVAICDTHNNQTDHREGGW